MIIDRNTIKNEIMMDIDLLSEVEVTGHFDFAQCPYNY